MPVAILKLMTPPFLLKANDSVLWFLSADVHSETSGAIKMALFAKIVNNFQLLTILSKSSVLDV